MGRLRTYPRIYAAAGAAAVQLLLTAGCAARLAAQRSAVASAIDAYVEPYVASGNFSGQLLVMRGSIVLYDRQLGLADRDRHVPMVADTRLHLASISMQFTAAAIMRLVDMHELSLDAHVSDFAPEVRGGERITIRNLLEQQSGLSDINVRADYNEILAHHQTPASLVQLIARDSLTRAPGSGYVREEHSAYNLLALVIEKVMGAPFARAMQTLVFAPAGLAHTVVDDDGGACARDAAVGYTPVGVTLLAPAAPIHWSAKSGNASVCSTARDLAAWVRALADGRYLSAASRAAILDSATPVGYGWFRRQSTRFHTLAYSMSGRAPGFASYVMYVPRDSVLVVALSNIYSSATADMGNDIAAIAMGAAYVPVRLPSPPLAPATMQLDSAAFAFPADFYQPNAVLAFEQREGELFLRWPSGDRSPIIVVDRDHAIDRAYWEPVVVIRDSAGKAIAITYDRFRGARAN